MTKSKGKGQFSDDNECRSIENALHIHEVLSLSYLSLCFSSTLFVATVSQDLEGLGVFFSFFFPVPLNNMNSFDKLRKRASKRHYS